MAKELLGQEISRQVQQKLTKDMLLGMDTSQKTLWEEALGLSDEAYRAQLEKLASCRYPWQDDLRLNTKLSVSDIKKEGEEESLEESAFLLLFRSFCQTRRTRGREPEGELLTTEPWSFWSFIKSGQSRISENSWIVLQKREE